PPHVHFTLLTTPPPPSSTLFPYTTLFRSLVLAPSGNGAELTMEIEDQAGEITVDPNHTGRGLLNIRDRADAIGADYRFNQENGRSEEHTSELQSRENLVCRLLLEKKKQEK